MNASKTVFLLNPKVRAVLAIYEDNEKAPRTMFKTLDQTIKVGDIVVVPTGTRHKFTCVKVVEVDVDVDFDTPETISWIVAPVELEEFEKVVAMEQEALDAVRKAEVRRKREELAATVFRDQEASLKELKIVSAGAQLPPPD
jgi:hypothetical protein